MWWLVALSCRDPEPEQPAVGELSGCDPLVPEVCALPWPSSLFEAEDPGTPTGYRLSFSETTFPVNRDGVPFRPDMFHHKDGYSTLGPLVVWFDGATLDGTISHTDLEAFRSPDAKTVIIDTLTHERVPHFVEIDSTTDKPGERVIFLRPVVPLQHGRRYVVGIRGLLREGGDPVAVSDAFRALRDGEQTSDADIETRRERFESLVFPELTQQGFAREELQLAWDFGTISRDSSLGPVLAARDDALTRAGDSAAITISSVEDEDCAVEGAHIARTIYGTFTSPRYTDLDAPGARLVRDDAGMPVWQGETEVDFMVRIPCSVALDPQGGAQLLQYGHGLLGDLGEARGDYLSALIDESRMVLWAQNWTGMSTDDAPYITLMMALDVSDFDVIPDRTVQGLTEWVVGANLAVGAFASLPEAQLSGQSVIDTTRPPVFYGNSQGAILGGAYASLSPTVERAVLGVGGGPYSLLLSRSVDFGPFFLIFQQKFEDHRDIALLLAAFQTVWDPGETAGYTSALTAADPLPGTPPKRYLMQVAVGDAQVSTLGAHILARSMGALSIGEAVRPIWGIEEQTAPIDGSGIVEWMYTDGSTEPVENLPPSDEGDTHECPRREPEAQAQLVHFLQTGTIEQYCDGPCVSSRAGLCD